MSSFDEIDDDRQDIRSENPDWFLEFMKSRYTPKRDREVPLELPMLSRRFDPPPGHFSLPAGTRPLTVEIVNGVMCGGMTTVLRFR